MHGASGGHRPKRLWWSQRQTGKDGRAGAAATERSEPRPRLQSEATDADGVVAPSRVRHIFPSSDPAQRFKAGGLIDDHGIIVDRAALHRLMVTLARCIEEASSQNTIADNPGIPAGYTYLLQFIAHDMSDSVTSLVREEGAMRPGAINARQQSLMLETLYGAGPESDTHAYAASTAVLVPNSNSLRTHLRVGAVQSPKPGSSTVYCPYRDLVRAKSPDDDGLGPDHGRWFTEVYVADRRNDSHAFLSQLTVLFLLLHNSIVSKLETLPDGPLALQEPHRRYLCARALVTLIYREIIMTDVLPRILDPAVLKRYTNEGKALFDNDPSVPVEFMHGAFRFAHSIVRDTYDIRGAGDLDTFIGLRFNSAASPKIIQVPSKQDWFIDWARFFKTAKTKDRLNLSKRIGPHYGIALRSSGHFPKKTDVDLAGLANRDLLTSCYSGLLSAPALSSKFQTIFGAALVRNYADWTGPLRQWLTAHWPGGTPDPTELDRLVRDPPLPFFVMFEAEQATGGERLGPVGSIIVAETMFGILTTQLTGFESAGPTLQAKVEACGAAMFPDRAAAARAIASTVGGLTSMPQVLEYLAGIGELPDLT